MLVYGHRTVSLNVAEFLRRFGDRLDRLPTSPDHDTVNSLLVDWGEAESAVADALLPHYDDDLDALSGWRAASDALADAACASWQRDAADCEHAIARARRATTLLVSVAPSGDVRAKAAEGFAHFALYPEQYMEAARRFAADSRPASVLCIGLRSIGSILAHVVAAALRRHGVRADTRSVRPRGHPFDRRLEITARLQTAFTRTDISHIAIVDEGPGLSGSSFAAAATCVLGLGVPAGRIVLFPSWDPAAERLRSPEAREVWTRHPKVTARFEEIACDGGRLFGTKRVGQELSAGEWRPRCFATPDEWPAVHAQHERRKYLSAAGDTILRYAGLGRRGRAIEQRALALCDAGFGAGVVSLAHGFLEQPWIDGHPLRRDAASTPRVLNAVASYLAFVRRAFVTTQPESIDEVYEMAATNALEGLGRWALAPVQRLAGDAREFAAPRVAVDGRMLPHEWIVTPERLFKVDALDHHDDDFWPGCRDIAWDVAGTIVEFDLSGEAVSCFIEAYARESGDWTIRSRVPFHQVAYLSYRQAYAALAAETLGDSRDGRAFTALRQWYRRSLAGRLRRPCPA